MFWLLGCLSNVWLEEPKASFHCGLGWCGLAWILWVSTRLDWKSIGDHFDLASPVFAQDVTHYSLPFGSLETVPESTKQCIFWGFGSATWLGLYTSNVVTSMSYRLFGDKRLGVPYCLDEAYFWGTIHKMHWIEEGQWAAWISEFQIRLKGQKLLEAVWVGGVESQWHKNFCSTFSCFQEQVLAHQEAFPI